MTYSDYALASDVPEDAVCEAEECTETPVFEKLTDVTAGPDGLTEWVELFCPLHAELKPPL